MTVCLYDYCLISEHVMRTYMAVLVYSITTVSCTVVYCMEIP